MANHLAGFARHLSARRAPRTIDTYLRALACLARFLAAGDLAARKVTRAEVEAFLGRPLPDGGRRAPSARNRELAALRAFAAFLRREGVWTDDPTGDVPFVRVPPHDPVVLTAPELGRVFVAALSWGTPRSSARALALVALLSQVGLRVHEVVALDVAQLDLDGATLLGVRGKGGTIVDLPLNAPTVALLRAWLEVRSGLDTADPALFLSSRKRRLSVRSVQRLVAALGRRAGLGRPLSPHALRHTAATLALRLGADLSSVSELLRHARVQATMRYLGLVSERRRETVRRLAATVPTEVLPKAEGDPAARPNLGADQPQFPGRKSLDVEGDFYDISGSRQPAPKSSNTSLVRSVSATPKVGQSVLGWSGGDEHDREGVVGTRDGAGSLRGLW